MVRGMYGEDGFKKPVEDEGMKGIQTGVI